MSAQERFMDAAKAFVEAKTSENRAVAAMLDAYNAMVTGPVDVVEHHIDDIRRNAVFVQRKRRLWSQQKLGLELGFPAHTAQVRVAQIERGFRKMTADLFSRIAVVFNMPMGDLEAVGRRDAEQWGERVLSVLRCAAGPITIAGLADRAELSTSDCWTELEPLLNAGRALKVPGGFVISKELS